MANTTVLSIMIMTSNMLACMVVIGASSDEPPQAPTPAITSQVGEAQALMDFKKGIASDPLGRLASWADSSTNPCTAAWSGIICDPHKQHVTSLNLASSNLSGSISPSLALLPALSYLDLSHNFLNGSLPSSLFLPHRALRYLDLSSNLLDGSLPDSFANLPALLTLDLSSNYFVGDIPPSLGQCKDLQRLFLMETGFTGRIPSEIWQLPALIKLQIVGDSLFEASLPQKFPSCPTIRALELSNVIARGSAFPAYLGECKQLRVLFLDVIGLEGVIPPEFWQLPLLQTLVVEDAEVSDSIDNSDASPFKLHGSLPSSFSCCPTITTLAIDGVNLTGEIPPSLGQCTSLQWIDLSHGSLQGAIPKALGNLSNLEVLYLESHMLTGTIPKELFQSSGFLLAIRLGDNKDLTGGIPREVGGLKQLEHLSLYTTSLLGPLPEELCNCTELIWLDLGWARQLGGVGKILNSFAKLAQLQTLGWQENAISGEVPMKALNNLTRLRYLDMTGCTLVGRIPPELGNLSNLQHLGFRANNLAGPIPVELSKLLVGRLDLYGNKLTGSLSEELFLGLANGGSITELYLSRNELQGAIPSSIGRLQKLQVFYLDQNEIQGRIPPSLGNCTALQDLVLANNRLEGMIPATLGQLASLSQNLLLSGNELWGEIPKELGALARLKVLDLSKNNLVGHVPTTSLENCTNLQTLRLSHNNINGRIENFDLSKVQQLTTFTVQQNNFIGGLPSGFTSSQSLVLFDVQRNNLSGTLPSAHIGTVQDGAVLGLMKLRVLVMSYNQLSGEIPGWVWKLRMLQVLGLSNNHFRGSMPATVTHLDYFKQDQSHISNQTTLYEEVPQVIKGTFQVLSYILNTRIFFDVSTNYLEGEIADSFGELVGLTGLSLSHNYIQGKIPKSLGKLLNLDELDLSHNKLTGSIPEELGQLGGLSMVDLSYNHLQGPIPTTNNFNTRYNYTSFEGNSGLCGIPLPVNCSTNKPPMTNNESKPDVDESHAWSFIDWIGSFASFWALLIAYPIGLLGGFYFLYHFRVIPRYF